MDAILIRDLRVEALIGIHRRERHVKQTLSIDLDIGLPGTAVFASDKVADTISDADPIDYAERRAGCIRFSGAVANGFAHTNTFAIERPVSPAFGDRIAGANPLAVS